MSRRTFNRNAYESTLTAELLKGATNTSVLSTIGLAAPIYLVVDPDVPGRTEWIKVLSITGNSFDTMERGLTGSQGEPGSGITHPVGAKVRSMSTQQIYEDIFDDIGDLESDIGDIGDELLDNYLRLDGTSPMTGALRLRSTLPTTNFEASPKLYVDNAEEAAKDYSDSLDHNHAAPIATHKSDASAHHTKYTDVNARNATVNTYIPLNGSKTATKLFVSGDVNLTTIRARVNDIHFEDLAGADLFRWDDSVDQWEFKKNLNMESHFLISPANPTTAAHVGDRGFNDGRYATQAHLHTGLYLTLPVADAHYVRLDGSTMTGILTGTRFIANEGSAGAPAFVLSESTNDTGIYGNDSLGRVGVSIDGGQNGDFVFAKTSFTSILSGKDLGAPTLKWEDLHLAGTVQAAAINDIPIADIFATINSLVAAVNAETGSTIAVLSVP